ncbi:MAG: lipopolysaccharide transport periplasmic protein LptA [Rhodobacteraceae bacterium]|nr:MAG: lipopolysaccharide transport periplasmic protein LptA [Paracoccaceae bacterium]
MKSILLAGFLAILSLSNIGAALAQGAQVPFAGLKVGANSTVEIAADSLSIDQDSGKAVFSGNVVAGIENMRLSADVVEVVYAAGTEGGTGAISGLIARGNVVFSNGEEAAEGDVADLDLEAGEIVMTGNVILTQGSNALSGQSLRIDLNTGTALIEGRVQTIFQTGGSE